MATARSKRVPMEEQIILINECRKSGLTDADWCRENGIAPSTFYNWISRCRKASAKILEPHYGHQETPQSEPDVVSIDILPEEFPETPAMLPLRPQAALHLDNSHTIEVVVKDITLRICNNADMVLLSQMIRLIRESSC